jgi:hypothetical protein
MFGPEDDGTVSIRLYRKDPKYLNGQRIYGYCGTVPFGEDLEWIAETHGGGSYNIQQYVNRKYVQSRPLFIAGAPRVSPPFAGSGAAALEKKAAAESEHREPVEDTAFWRNLRQIMVERAILKSFEPPAITDQLLSYLMDRKNPDPVDPMEAVTKSLEAVSHLKELLTSGEPPAAAGDGLLGIFNKALDLLPKIAAARSPRPILHRPAPPALDAPPASTQPPTPEPEPVSVFKIAQAAIGTTVQAFLEEPPFTADQTIQALRQIVPMTPELGQSLQENKKALYDGAVLALHQAVEPDPAEDEKFRLFFDEVFSKLTANT